MYSIFYGNPYVFCGKINTKLTGETIIELLDKAIIYELDMVIHCTYGLFRMYLDNNINLIYDEHNTNIVDVEAYNNKDIVLALYKIKTDNNVKELWKAFAQYIDNIIDDKKYMYLSFLSSSWYDEMLITKHHPSICIFKDPEDIII